MVGQLCNVILKLLKEHCTVEQCVMDKAYHLKEGEVIDWSALGLIKALRAGQQNIDSEIFQYPWEQSQLALYNCIRCSNNRL